MKRTAAVGPILGIALLLTLVVAVSCGPAATPTPTPTLKPPPTPTATATPTTAAPQQPQATATPTPTAKPVATAVATPTPTATATATPVPQPMGPSGTLAVALDTIGTSPDPRLGSRPVWQQYNTLSFDMLLDVEPFKGTLQPGAAVSWEVASDGLSWTFKMRKDMKFWDGKPVTAQDAVFGFNWEISKVAVIGGVTAYRKAIKSVEALDEYTVRVNLTAPNAVFNYEISSTVEPVSVIIPKHYIEGNNVNIDDKNGLMHQKPLGSGPWKFVSFKAGDKREWEAWAEKHPYRPMPAFQKLVMYEVPEQATRMAMARTGEVSIIVVTPDAVPELEGAGLAKVFVPESNIGSLMFTSVWDPRAGEKHPLQDVRVRKAIAMSIDRERIIKTVMGGLATFPLGGASWTTTYSLPNVDAEREFMRKEIIPYDVAGAKKLLEEAGYPGGKGIPALNWNAYFHMGSPWLTTVTLAASEMVQKSLGIKVKLNIMDDPVFQSLFRETGIDDESTVAALATRRTACRPIGLPRTRQAFDPKEQESLLAGMKEDGSYYWKSPFLDEYLALLKKTETNDPAARKQAEFELKRWTDKVYLWPPMVAGGATWGYNPKKLQEWTGTPCRTEIGIIYEYMKPAK